MRRIAIAAAKGGTAKTTTAVTLAHGLALAGKQVVLVDLDPQNHVGHHFGLDADGGVAALLQGGEARCTEVRESLWVIQSGGPKLAALERDMSDDPGKFGGELQRALQCADTPFDFQLLDCPASFGPLHLQAMAAANEILVPVSTDHLGLQAVAQLLQQLRWLAQTSGSRPRLLGLLPTLYDPTAPSTAHIERRLRDEHAGRVLQTRIRLADPLRLAPAEARSVFDTAPLSTAAADYAALTQEVLDLA